jgi:hypothetical protein
VNHRPAKRILLIGWDAADWKLLNPLLDAGELPALNQIVEQGVAGELLACPPLDTASLWTSLATGKRPWQHGVHHSRALDAQNNRLLPVSRQPRRVRALWEMLAEKNLRSLIIGWPATQDSETSLAQIVSDRFSEPTAPPGVKPWPPAISGTYAPDALRKNLDALRVSPADIGADVIAQYIPDWQKIDRQTDRRPGQLRVLLAPDFSHFAAARQLMQQTEWDFAAVRFPALGHLAGIFLPFQPPRRPWINEREFALYQHVIRAACCALDRTLAALRRFAGPDTTIILTSPHGTRTPDIPPNGFPQNDEHGWKSAHGLFAASGPGWRRDALLHHATVLDVAPTILALFGLPIGDDMEGRVLLESFQIPLHVQHVSSWDKNDAKKIESAAAGKSLSPIAQKIHYESEWNFAQSALEAGRLNEARSRLENLFRSFPENPEFCHALFQCQLRLNRLDDAQTTLEVLLETVPPGIGALLPQAELALARRELRQARRLAEAARQQQPRHPAALRRLGLLLLRLREWNAVADLSQAALKQDENDPLVWLGLAEASLRLHQTAAAENAARRAIQLKYFLPDAHFILARALVAQNKWPEARAAMAALRELQPENKSAAGYDKLLTRAAKTTA